MSTWQAGELLINGVHIYYERSGSGQPALLFVHGLTDSGHYWRPILGQLPPGYELVLYDARGHGRSEQPPGGYTYDQLAEDLAGVITALNLAQPIVIGHSMGAATAALMAARHPGLARALILEDPPAGHGITTEQLQAVFDDWRTDLLATKALGPAEKLAKARATRPDWAEADYAEWVEDKTLVAPQALDIIHTPGTPWFDLIEQVDCPILLITGEPELGALVTPDFAKELAGRWRQGQIVHIDGVGHSIRRGQPARYAQAVCEFLAAYHTPRA